MIETYGHETPIGTVTHYWSHLGVAGVHLDAPLDVGDHIHVLGHTSNFEQDVKSLEIEHQHVYHAEPGMDVGLAVMQHAREHDKIYKAVPMSDVAEGEASV